MIDDRPATLAETLVSVRETRHLLNRPTRLDLRLSDGSYLVFQRPEPRSDDVTVRLLCPEGDRMVFKTPPMELDVIAWRELLRGEGEGACAVGEIRMQRLGGRLRVIFEGKTPFCSDAELGNAMKRFLGARP